MCFIEELQSAEQQKTKIPTRETLRWKKGKKMDEKILNFLFFSLVISSPSPKSRRSNTDKLV